MNTKIVFRIICLLSGLILLTSCMAQNKNAPMEDDKQLAFDQGIIIEQSDNGQMLLVTQYYENEGEPSISAIQLSISTETLLEDSDGAVLAANDFTIGQQVKVWTSGDIAVSYPEQAAAGKIVLLSDVPGQSATPITKAMAIQSALEVVKPRMAGAIKNVTLVDAAGFWEVKVVDSEQFERVNTIRVDAQNGDVIREPVAENDTFRIFTPAPQEEAESTFRVMGEARVFEAMFHWSLEDGHNILAEGHIMAEQGAPEWGQFEFDVSFGHVSNPTLSLILYELSAKDGNIVNQLIVPLKAPVDMIERPS